MTSEVIILICTNIAVPIVVSIITAISQTKKYKKEISLLNAEHENKIKELSKDFEHQIEIIKLEHQHEKELENQKTANTIAENLTEKVADAILNQPATQRMINQRTNRSFLNQRNR